MRPKKPQNRTRNFLALILIAVASFTGCTESKQEASTSPANQSGSVASPSATTVAVAEEQKKQPEYFYDPAGRRDPFSPIIVKAANASAGLNRPPLERHALSDFKITGIVWGKLGYTAMLQAPDGKGYFVKEGAIVGVNRGVVKKITTDSLIVLEAYKNFLGEDERKEIIMNLRTKQEGVQ